jgi:DNA-binding response OmpR family regulator/EAL domain-containing protein (putative c-di-GMP-specific phosphodiesterase class I)
MSSESGYASLTPDLSEALQKIEDNWPILPSGLWNSSSIQKLSRLLHELTLRSEAASATEFHQQVVEIDTEINQIIDDNAPPDHSQMDRLTHSLEQLRTQVGRQSSSKPIEGPARVYAVDTSPFDLLFLCASSEEAELLTASMQASGLLGAILTDPEELHAILAGPGSKTLLIDASFLGMQALEPVLHLIKVDRSSAPELFIISDQSTVETRLAAMRADAVHLFTKPIEADHLIETLKQHIHPLPCPRHRVLIVEDDESQAKFASKLLEKGELETLAISEPLGVLEAVYRFQPDLILMDLYMPGADGIELTRMIRDRWQSAAIPVVFLSGEDDPEKKLLALLAGADDFLTKPVRPQQLLATVKTRISRAHQIADVTLRQVCQSSQSSQPGRRRELLNALDLALAEEATLGFRALLIIQLGSADAMQVDGSDPKLSESVSAAQEAIRPLMQAGDTLALLEHQGLALLCQRNDELALESLAERLYEGVLKSLSKAGQDRFGLGVVLLNSENRHAYEVLCKGESCAQSAYERNLEGYQLYGEETPATAEAETAHPGDSTECELLRSALKEGSLPIRQQLYSSQKEHAVETFELLPQLPHAALQVDLYQLAANCEVSTRFDRLVYQHALLELSKQIAKGHPRRILFRQSPNLVTEADSLEFMKSQLRRCQIVGTGLIMEFDLPSLAANLQNSRVLIGELAAMGITVALANFTCNTTAFKVLSYLRANAIRPHPSLLQLNIERVQQIAQQARALQAEIILPRAHNQGDIALPWAEFADYIQADFSD